MDQVRSRKPMGTLVLHTQKTLKLRKLRYAWSLYPSLSLSLSHTHEASHFLWFISSIVSNSFWDGYKITDRSRIFSFHIAVVGLCIWFKVWGNTCFKQNWVSWDLSVLNVQEWDRAHSLWRGSSGLFDTTEWCWMPIHCTSQMEVGTCKESFTINLCTRMFNL
jgi:hypothetical protein